MQSNLTDFTKKHENDKKSPITTKITSKIPTPSVVEPKNDTTWVYASPQTPDNIISQPSTVHTGTSSSPPPVTTRFENLSSSTISDLIAPDGIISGSETSSEATSFPQNHTKTRKPPVLIKEYPETQKAPTSGPLNWADDANTLPISTTLPQHAPRDLSCLRSTSVCPFLSLRR